MVYCLGTYNSTLLCVVGGGNVPIQCERVPKIIKSGDYHYSKQSFGKQDSYFLRSIATMMVIVAHYSNYIYGLNENRTWNLLSKLGRYGVAIFFLVSGYGLVYSIKEKNLNYIFLLHRIKCLYFPFMIMQFLSLVYVGKPSSQMSLKDWFYYFIGIDYWYVIIMFFLYCYFYLSMKFFKKYHEIILFLSVSLLNISLALMGCEEWWYLTNYVFCLGVFLAVHERNIKINNLYLAILLFLCFVIVSLIYSKIDEILLHDLFKIIAGMSFAGGVWFIYKSIPFRIYWNPINSIGKCSLYIYILHIQALGFIQKYNISSYIVIILSIIVVILISMLLEKVIAKLMNI